MAGEVVIGLGTLGWSNKRGGLEFYALQPPDEDGNRQNGRWEPRRRGGDTHWGDLLVDSIEDQGAYEGAQAIVFISNRGGPDLHVHTEKIMRAVAQVLRDEG